MRDWFQRTWSASASANQRAGIIDQQLSVLFSEGTVAGLDDARLLERFAARRDEPAFAALVERHGADGPGRLPRFCSEDAHKATTTSSRPPFSCWHGELAHDPPHPDRLGAWLPRGCLPCGEPGQEERVAPAEGARGGRHVAGEIGVMPTRRLIMTQPRCCTRRLAGFPRAVSNPDRALRHAGRFA